MRDFKKLEKIIAKQVEAGVVAENLNDEVFAIIIQEYNENMPVNRKLRNIRKNRKMIFTKMKRYPQKKQNKDSNVPENRKDLEDSQIAEIESSNINRNEALNDSEKCALDALLSLSEIDEETKAKSVQFNETVLLEVNEKVCDTNNIKIVPHGHQPQESVVLTFDELCALDALLSLYEVVEKSPKLEPIENITVFFKEEEKVEKGPEYFNIEYNYNIECLSQDEETGIDAGKRNNQQLGPDSEFIYNNECQNQETGNDGRKRSSSNIRYANQEHETGSNVMQIYNSNIENILINFVDQLKGMFEKLIEQFSVAITNNLRDNEISSNRNTNNASSTLNISELRVPNSKNTYKFDNSILVNDSILTKNNESLNERSNVLNSSNLTLGPFDISNNSLKVEKYEKYRKTPNPKEKLNRDVNRSEGVATKRTRCFKNNIFDCDFQICPTLIFDAKDDDKLKLSKNKFVLDAIREEYLKVNNACIISFYSTKTLASGLLVYGYCTFTDCCKYRFKVNLDGRVTVYRTGNICHAKGEKRVAQIRGVTRKIVKKALRGTSAYRYRKKQILNASDDIAKSGNMQSITNLSTLNKCRSEGRADTWNHPDPFQDVFLMQQKKYKGYIQYLASPLTIYCWELETFITFSENPDILKDANYTIHFDASGQSVRQIECAEKRIFVYKIVIRIKKLKMIIPVVTAILSRHSLNEICGIFEKLEQFCIKYNIKWPLFQRVCTDVGAAVYGAVLKCYNNQHISQYLTSCFRYLENPKRNKKPKVIVQWCKSHYIHIMCKDLNNKIGKHNPLRHFLKHVLTMAFDLKTLGECRFWFKHIFTVLLYPKKNYIYMESLNILKKNIMETEELDEVDYEDVNLLDDEEQCSLENIANRSPFKKVFLKIYEDITNDIKNLSTKGEDNDIRNEEMCKFIMSKYCPLVPMWTNIMGILVDPSGDHVSNAPVEFSFFLQKHILLDQKSMRPGDFIKIDREDNISSLKELRYKYNMFGEIDTSKYTLSLKKSKKNTKNSLPPEEEWNKPDPRKQKAINPKHLFTSKKNKKFEKPRDDIQDIIEVLPDGRIPKEHTYSMPIVESESRKNEKIQYFLLRYNDLFNSIFPTFKQFELGFYNFLDGEDWNSLKEGCMLTNFVVDIAIFGAIKEGSKNVLSLPCQINEINYERTKTLISLKPDLLFIPIIQNSHFNLCILKPATLEFVFIDSLHDHSGKAHYNAFVATSRKNGDESNWKFFQILERTTQDDGVSCGVFVILYVLCFLKGDKMTNLPHPNLFRQEIKSILFKYADDCSKFCCHCGNSRKTKTKCLKCNYRVCKDCIVNKYANSFTVCKICTNILM